MKQPLRTPETLIQSADQCGCITCLDLSPDELVGLKQYLKTKDIVMLKEKLKAHIKLLKMLTDPGKRAMGGTR